MDKEVQHFTPEEFAEENVSGMPFCASEAMTFFRGVVKRVHFDKGYFSMDVGEVEAAEISENSLLNGLVWIPRNDFSYGAREPDICKIGEIYSINIMYIASIVVGSRDVSQLGFWPQEENNED